METTRTRTRKSSIETRRMQSIKRGKGEKDTALHCTATSWASGRLARLGCCDNRQTWYATVNRSVSVTSPRQRRRCPIPGGSTRRCGLCQWGEALPALPARARCPCRSARATDRPHNAHDFASLLRTGTLRHATLATSILILIYVQERTSGASGICPSLDLSPRRPSNPQPPSILLL